MTLQRPKLTKATKQRISDGWVREFPSLAVYKPMWLLKRAGPLLIGICLDRDSSNERYIPTFHLHNLLSPSTKITLTLPHSLNSITVKEHEAAYTGSISEIKEKFSILDCVDINMSMVENCYHGYIEENSMNVMGRYPLAVYIDLYLLTSWLGYKEYADSLLEYSCSEISKWPKNAFSLDLTEWKAVIKKLTECRSKQSEMIQKHIKLFKLENIPKYDLASTIPIEFWVKKS